MNYSLKNSKQMSADNSSIRCLLFFKPVIFFIICPFYFIRALLLLIVLSMTTTVSMAALYNCPLLRFSYNVVIISHDLSLIIISLISYFPSHILLTYIY